MERGRENYWILLHCNICINRLGTPSWCLRPGDLVHTVAWILNPPNKPVPTQGCNEEVSNFPPDPPQMWQSDLFTCSEQVRILVFHLSTGVPQLAVFQGFSCPASSISSWKWWGCGSWKPHRTGHWQVSKDRSGPPSTWSCQRPINGRIITVQDVQYTYLLSHDLMQPINSFWMDFLIPVRHPGCEGDNVQLTRQQVIHGGDLTRRREGLQTPWFHV